VQPTDTPIAHPQVVLREFDDGTVLFHPLTGETVGLDLESVHDGWLTGGDSCFIMRATGTRPRAARSDGRKILATRL